MVKENTNLEEIPWDNENEDESEEGNEEDHVNLGNSPKLKLKAIPSFVSQPTISYLDFIKPQINDFDMIGINMSSTLLKKKKIKQKKVS